MNATAGGADVQLGERMGLGPGMTVQELGWDEDVDDALRIQLENAIDRWLITGDGNEIGADEVQRLVAEWDTPDLPALAGEMLPLQAVEQRYIAWVLEKVGGNKTRAAEILQIDPSTLYRRGRQRNKT